MSLNRFENLRRYLHISKPTLESIQAPIPADDNENIDEFWWWRLEPMLSTFRD